MPIPNYNQDITYWCSLTIDDVEPSDSACLKMASEKITSCCQCPFLAKQYYTMVIQDESQKEFISPSRKK